MAFLGELSVRTESVGGNVAAAVTAEPPDWPLGRRHIVLLVHGYNVDMDAARSSYTLAFTDALADVGYFFWPGDTRGGILISSASYPFQITNARDSARLLADYLSAAFGPEGAPSAVSLVGHSLGCRLVLEALKIVFEEGRAWPDVRLVCLMAAAVPVDLLESGMALESAARQAKTLVLLYSFLDDVLHYTFPSGQAAAFLFGIEEASYGRAVGRFGLPEAISPNRIEEQLGHGDYWRQESGVASLVASFLGAAVPRDFPARMPLAESGPVERHLLDARTTPTRRLPGRARLIM
jgi:pimeloyl-ACP methyl ester carboxylesterase